MNRRRPYLWPRDPNQPASDEPGAVHFTPTACSWLNAVETFFAALTKRRLRRGVFRSIVDLQAAIHRYIVEHNTGPKPFVWTADLDRFLAAINRGKQVLESAH